MNLSVTRTLLHYTRKHISIGINLFRSKKKMVKITRHVVKRNLKVPNQKLDAKSSFNKVLWLQTQEQILLLVKTSKFRHS